MALIFATNPYGNCPDCGRPLDGWHQNDCQSCGWEATA